MNLNTVSTQGILAERGAPAEIRHAILLAITTIGFPRAMAALSRAEDILKRSTGKRSSAKH